MSANRTRSKKKGVKKAWKRLGTGFAYKASVMKNENARIVKAMSRGSIMMEYVIVVSAISVAVLVFMNWSFYNVATGFGPLGQEIVAFFQRLQGGLSLPIP